MAARIHLVRHAESQHNIDHDFNRPDPELTALGQQQASVLGQTFPHANDVGLVITSPLRRAIQTTLVAFRSVLDKRYYDDDDDDDDGGVEGGAELLLDPDVQERSALPCDTGSSRRALEDAFPALDFTRLDPGWLVKDRFYAPDDDAVLARAGKVRDGLRERVVAAEKAEGDRQRRDIVVVTHGVFMKFLSGDPDIDLPKAGWKSYTVGEGGGGGCALLIPV